MTFPALVPPPPTQVYIPRVFGFKIHNYRPASHKIRDQSPQQQQRNSQAQRANALPALTATAGEQAKTKEESLPQQKVGVAGTRGPVFSSESSDQLQENGQAVNA